MLQKQPEQFLFFGIGGRNFLQPGGHGSEKILRSQIIPDRELTDDTDHVRLTIESTALLRQQERQSKFPQLCPRALSRFPLQKFLHEGGRSGCKQAGDIPQYRLRKPVCDRSADVSSHADAFQRFRHKPTIAAHPLLPERSNQLRVARGEGLLQPFRFGETGFLLRCVDIRQEEMDLAIQRLRGMDSIGSGGQRRHQILIHQIVVRRHLANDAAKPGTPVKLAAPLRQEAGKSGRPKVRM